jgi:probable HAF family extracellular repeat protein
VHSVWSGRLQVRDIKFWRRARATFVLLLLLCAVGGGSTALAAKLPITYNVVDLGDFNGLSCGGDPLCNFGSGAYGLNSRGDVVGWSYYTWDGSVAAFQYVHGSRELIRLQSLPGMGWSRYGYAINDSGVVAGTASALPSYRPNHPVLWRSGFVENLFGGIESCDAPYGLIGVDCSGIATDINSHGQVVGGRYITQRGGNPTGVHGAFVYSGGTFNDIGWLPEDVDSFASAINDRGDVVGTSLPFASFFGKTCCGEDLVTREGGGRAFIYRRGSMRDLGTLGGPLSGANDISLNRRVVGYADTAHGERHAFLYGSDGRMRDLGTLGGTFSEATAISPDGTVIVGNSTTAAGELRGFVYIKGKMLDLNSLIPHVGLVVDAQDVNDAGQIAARVVFSGSRPLQGSAVLLDPTA